MALRISWLAAVAVLVGALAVAATGDTGSRTQQERVYEIAASVRCPECDGQSAAESDSASSRAIRATIAEALAEGTARQAILDDLASSYGEGILLEPSTGGFTGLVWFIPPVAVVAAGAGLVMMLRRWSNRPSSEPTGTPTTGDEELVARALAARRVGEEP